MQGGDVHERIVSGADIEFLSRRPGAQFFGQREPRRNDPHNDGGVTLRRAGGKPIRAARSVISRSGQADSRCEYHNANTGGGKDFFEKAQRWEEGPRDEEARPLAGNRDLGNDVGSPERKGAAHS